MIRSMLLDVLFLVVSVTTLCQGARIVISAIPSTITEGVTHTFAIRCALEVRLQCFIFVLCGAIQTRCSI
ncbi:hypothetical protein BsWGS_25852 [Bradybaena similaris]